MPNETPRTPAAFEDHPAFAPTGDAEYELTTNPFEAIVSPVTDGDDESTVAATVRVPTLSAVVTDERVAPVVEDGWFETLVLRLEDVGGVTQTATASVPDITRTDDVVVVDLTLTSGRPDRLPDEVKAVFDAVEGTWVLGLIPGYEYADPAKSLLQRAEQDYDESGTGGPPL